MFEDYARKLVELDPVERIAQNHYVKTGEKLPYDQYRAAMDARNLPDQPTLQNTQQLYPDNIGIEIRKVPRYVELGPQKRGRVSCIQVVNGPLHMTILDQEFFLEKNVFVYIPVNVPYELLPEKGVLAFEYLLEPQVFAELGFKDKALLRMPMVYETEKDDVMSEYALLLYDSWERDSKRYATTVYHLFFAMATYASQRYQFQWNDLHSHVWFHPQAYDILSYMGHHYNTVTLKELAETFHFSVPYLSALIHKEMGVPFSTLLREYRLSHAEEMLRETPMKVEEIGKAVGFRESAQFIRAFKAEYGMTPAKYRNEHRRNIKY